MAFVTSTVNNVYSSSNVPGLSNPDFHHPRSGFLDPGDAVLAADGRRNRAVRAVCLWGLRVARPRDAAALGSPEETGCGGALPVGAESHVLERRLGFAGRGGHLSIVSAPRVGCRIRRGCECVCAALRGARAQTEIRRGI